MKKKPFKTKHTYAQAGFPPSPPIFFSIPKETNPPTRPLKAAEQKNIPTLNCNSFPLYIVDRYMT